MWVHVTISIFFSSHRFLMFVIIVAGWWVCSWGVLRGQHPGAREEQWWSGSLGAWGQDQIQTDFGAYHDAIATGSKCQQWVLLSFDILYIYCFKQKQYLRSELILYYDDISSSALSLFSFFGNAFTQINFCSCLGKIQTFLMV